MVSIFGKSILGLGSISLALLLTACAPTEQNPDSAHITRIEPIVKTVETPREVCQNHTTIQRKAVRDQHQIAGTATGAAVGGVLGNQVGQGRGKSVATATGAVVGGLIGNKAQENYQNNNYETVVSTQCNTVVDRSETVTGYLVHYDLAGQQGSVRMDQAPEGTSIPVLNGQLVLNAVPVNVQPAMQDG